MTRSRKWKNLTIALAAILLIVVACIGFFWWKILKS